MKKRMHLLAALTLAASLMATPVYAAAPAATTTQTTVQAAKSDVTVLVPEKKPAAVKATKSRAKSKTVVRLYWNKVAGCSGYQIKVYSDAKRTKLVKTVYSSNAATGYNVTGLKKGTKYYFSIRSFNKGDWKNTSTTFGKWDNSLSRTTKK